MKIVEKKIDDLTPYPNNPRINDGNESENEKYNAFVEKFKPKKTTDDCYTPKNIYDVISTWVSKKYYVDQSRFVRPFYPGGNYEIFPYKESDVVVDNPPFSKFTEICKFFTSEKIPFFIFAPGLTTFHAIDPGATCVCVGASITYDNGAIINTNFVTNLESENIAAKTEPELYMLLTEENKKTKQENSRKVSKYKYPNEIVTAAMMNQWCKYGVEFSVPRNECHVINALDVQKQKRKTIFGLGCLLSERAAAERAAAERAAAERAAAERAAAEIIELSDREKEIVKSLGRTENDV